MKLFIVIFLIIKINLAYAESFNSNKDFELPRFVSTKFDESNLRKGADTDYPIQLTYVVKNFPLEIIDENTIWRKVMDIEGNQGWMHKNLLKGSRYGIIKTSHNESSQIYNKPKGNIIGEIGNRNIVKINKCFSSWCHINFNKNKGWINKINIWGVYNEEEFNMPFYQPLINLYWKII